MVNSSAIIEVRNSDSLFKTIYEKFSKWLKEDLGDEYDCKLYSNSESMSIIIERKDGYRKEILTAKHMGRCLLLETFSPLILFLVGDIVEKIPKNRVHKKRNRKRFKTIQFFMSFDFEPCKKGGSYEKICDEA